jgi:hypothetical protein
MSSLNNDVVEFVRGRQPSTAGEAAAAADLCYSVKSMSKVQGHLAHQANGKNQCVRLQGSNTGKPQQSKVANDDTTSSSLPVAKRVNRGEQEKPKACCSCGSLSHKRAECPTSAQIRRLRKLVSGMRKQITLHFLRQIRGVRPMKDSLFHVT